MQDKYSNESLKYLNFGIFYPNKSSPTLRIYFPINLFERLKANASEFLNKNINFDEEKAILNIPEILSCIDDNFKDNINYYKE